MRIPSKQLGSLSDSNNVDKGATCDSSVSVGDWVRRSGTTYFRAQADSAPNAHVVGVCIAKTSSTVADIRVGGYTEDLYTTLSVTSTYFLSDTTPGAMATTAPTTTGTVHIRLGKPRNDKSLIINIGHILVRA